jgi:hypothetical protein
MHSLSRPHQVTSIGYRSHSDGNMHTFETRIPCTDARIPSIVVTGAHVCVRERLGSPTSTCEYPEIQRPFIKHFELETFVYP